jgi:hypothetical protein
VSREESAPASPGSGTPENKRGLYRKALDAATIQAVAKVTTLEGLDGLVLAGGSDIDPALYGAPRHPKTGKPDHDRDSLEAALLREALRGHPDRYFPISPLTDRNQFTTASADHCIERCADLPPVGKPLFATTPLLVEDAPW